MKDERKTKAQLIKELQEARKQAEMFEGPQRKQAKGEMTGTRENLKTILARSPFGVVVIGRDRKVRWANEYARILANVENMDCLLYTSPSPRDVEESRMPSSA